MKDNYPVQQKDLIEKIKNNVAGIREKATVVKMRVDYNDTKEICLTSVVFPPKTITKKITEKIIKPLRDIEGDHFYYPEDFVHITIKNIRTIHNPPLFTEEDAKKVNELFNKLIPQLPSFTFEFKELVLFPTGVALIGYSNSNLKKLVQALGDGLNKIAVPDNKKYFSDSVFFGNINVCRLAKPPGPDFKNKVKELEGTYIGEVLASQVHLLACNAFCNPDTRKFIGAYQLAQA